MSTTTHSAVTQFLFVADSGSAAIFGNRINGDGSLSPVPGSPFSAQQTPQKVAALGPYLLVAGSATITAYAVDKQSGALQPIDALGFDSSFELVVDAPASVLKVVSQGQVFSYRIIARKFQQLSAGLGLPSPAVFARAANPPALDATGRFAYFVNTGAAEISAFHFDQGKLSPLSPPSYPAGKEPASVAVVVP
jgi:6-phosphogluconolactonase (cycloisomerase 2 family)